MVIPRDNDNAEERDYLLTGEPDIVKPLTMHLLAILERFEELEQKVEMVLDLLAELRNRRARGQVKDYPKITLYFEQQKKDVNTEFPVPLSAQLSFRWMKYTVEQIRNNEKAVRELATVIKTKFARPPLYFEKGKKVGMYNDPKKGFNFVWSEFKDETNAKKVFEQMLDIQKKTPDWENLIISSSVNPTKAYEELPDKKMVMGELIREPRKRPLGRVYFKYAYIIIPPKKKPIYLCDVSGKKDALVEV